MNYEDFCGLYPVSRETFSRLEIYHALLVKWQRAVNLVGPKTIPEAWVRHFADSAQLLDLIPADAKKLMDLGSGAGFPGAVLAILRPDLEVVLIESDNKKSQFLKAVSRETNAEFLVENARIEAAADAFLPDIVTARALASLEDLFGYCLGWAGRNPALRMVFLKGVDYEAEIEAARKSFDFFCEARPSIISSDGCVLSVHSLGPLS